MVVPKVVFQAADADAPPAAGLIRAMVDEMVPLYGPIDGDGTPSATPADFSPPGGVFLVGWIGSEVVAGGGLKRLGPGVGEVKRMYVVPAWRGQGVASALLAALEEAALERGLHTVRLDTGSKQEVALGLYQRRGYVAVADYNANPKASYWGEKRLRGEGGR